MGYELTEAVRVETSFNGERVVFEHAAGKVEPKSEQEEAALELLHETQPKVCKRATGKAPAKGSKG